MTDYTNWGFNFVGFDPTDPKYADKVQTFFKVFENLNLLDIYNYDFSIDVYYLDMQSVIKTSGSYFKQLALLSSFADESIANRTDNYSYLNTSYIISELPLQANGYTFTKFMNAVKSLNKKLSKVKSETNTRTDYFTIVKYSYF